MKCVHIDSPQGVIHLIKVDNVVCPKWRTYFGFPVDIPNCILCYGEVRLDTFQSH